MVSNKVLLYSTGNYIQYLMINHNGKEYTCAYVCVCVCVSCSVCLTLCDSMDCSPPPMGFSACGIFQARTLECVAISFSNA